MEKNIKKQEFLSHYKNLFRPISPSPAGGSRGMVDAMELTTAEVNYEVSVERSKDMLDRLIKDYLKDDPDAADIAAHIRREGGEVMKRFGGGDGTLFDEPNSGAVVEVIARTDGSRPSFLITNGLVDRNSSVLGDWGRVLDDNEEQILQAIECVGRIDVANQHVGTGFLIGQNYIITNRHVLQAISSFSSNNWKLRDNTTIDFGREFNGKETLNRRIVKKVVFTGSQAINPSLLDHQKLDLAILELEPSKSHKVDPLRYSSSTQWRQLGSFLCIIGYPGPPPSSFVTPSLLDQLFRSQFGFKRLAPGLVQSPTKDTPSWTLSHDATTLGGNSGSAIISMGTKGDVVGLHYGGTWQDPRINWGHVLASVTDQTDIAGAKLGSVLTAIRTQKKVATTGEKKRVDKNARSLKDMKHLGLWPGASRTESMELEAAGDGETPHGSLQSRSGYDPNFIPDFNIPLPMPSDDMRELRRGGSGVELKYQHFSVILSASRKLPIITATNIDGAQSRRMPRIDRWNYDGRLDRDDQWGNELYQNNDLDRGHMVRREDPVWGTPDAAGQANRDTFHYTNSCPQMAGVNQRTWLGLENYILSHTRDDQMTVSVFTGPYFSESDFPYRGALVPKAFWKIVAFLLEDGNLSATAYRVSQEQELQDLEFVFAAYSTFQISIQSVMDDTGIDFSSLVPFDGFSTHELTTGTRLEEKITNLSMIRA